MVESDLHRLYVNGRFLIQKQTGVQRFAYEVVHALDALLAEPEQVDLRGRVALVTPVGVKVPAGLVNIRQIEGGALGNGYAWEQINLPRLSANGVLLNLCNLGPLAKRKQVVVIHDASTRAVPEAFSRAFRSIYGVLIPAIARRAAQLATVSEFSRGEISHWFGVPKSRLLVCHEGAEHILRKPAEPSVLTRYGLASGQYFLAVGMGPANKNQGLLLDAFSRARLHNVRLVLTGRRDTRVHGAEALAIPPGVIHVGHVPDGQLRALYEGALALVYPSSYEGFGLPPLEAMACGCPVVIGSQTALLEIASNAAYVVPMGDTAGFTAALQQIAAEPDLRARLVEQGQIRVRRFTWRTTAKRLLAQCQVAGA